MTKKKSLSSLSKIVESLEEDDVRSLLSLSPVDLLTAHYRFWGKPGNRLRFNGIEDSFLRLSKNPTVLRDLHEVIEWAMSASNLNFQGNDLPYQCPLELHANYASQDIQAVLGNATFVSPGQQGVGVLHYAAKKTYALLITFQKSEREFSPTTMYADYPISRELLHWESQLNTSRESLTGQNLLHHEERGYHILIFARSRKRVDQWGVPYMFLGTGKLVQSERERPIRIVWRLDHPMPVELFEENRRGG